MPDFYKKCEESLKKKILDLYGKYMSENQVKLFNEKDYTTNEAMSIKKLNDIFNYLMNKMLNDLINVTYMESITIDEEDILLPFGKTLENVLKNYYKINISSSLGFTPNINYDYAFDMDFINYLNTELDQIIDKNIFIKDAKELSEIEELSTYIKSTKAKDYEDYMNEEKNRIV